jgi:hypothetical protein
MDTALLTTIVSTSGAVITGVFGMFFMANQLGRRIDDSNASLGRRIDDSNASLGKRIDDLNVSLGKRIDDLNVSLSKRIDDLRTEFKELRSEFHAFKDVVNGKLQDHDYEIGKLMDGQKPN